jgi:hypothetical protein
MGRRPVRPITEIDLTLEEQEHVRNALQFLRVKLGGWRSLTKLLKFEETTLIKSGNGSRTVTASMAFRIARLVGVSVEMTCDLYWIRYERPDGLIGYCQRFGLDSPRSTYPKTEAEAKAARLEASSATGTKYRAERSTGSPR